MGDMVKAVSVGDSPIELRHFSAYKMFEATEALTRIGDAVPEILDHLATFVSNYTVSHSPRIPRATAEFTYGDTAKQVSEEAWKAAENVLAMTVDPSQAERLAAIFPLAFRKAREHMTRLLCVVATPNSEFEEADEKGEDIYAPGGLIDSKRKRILHKGTTAQMIALLSAAIDVCADELKAVDGEKVGKILDLLGLERPTKAAGASGSKNVVQRSSSGSPKRSRAPRAAKSSTGSPGASSAPSPAS